jgi:hypothetical protein
MKRAICYHHAAVRRDKPVPQTVIANPIINSPFRDPARHCRLIVEVSGEARKDKAAKVATVGNLWVPAINNHGAFGRWAFVEITDPWDAVHTIRGMLAEPWRQGNATTERSG